MQRTRSREAGQPAFPTGGFHHLTLRVTDLARAEAFYTTVLGFPEILRAEGLVLLNVQGTILGLRAGAPETELSDRFSPFRVGLDHLALAVPSTKALRELQRHLDVTGVPNYGIEEDPRSGTASVTFYDPDGIAWELYALPIASA